MKPMLMQAREWYRKGWITEDRYNQIKEQIKERHEKPNNKEYSNRGRVAAL